MRFIQGDFIIKGMTCDSEFRFDTNACISLPYGDDEVKIGTYFGSFYNDNFHHHFSFLSVFLSNQIYTSSDFQNQWQPYLNTLHETHELYLRKAHILLPDVLLDLQNEPYTLKDHYEEDNMHFLSFRTQEREYHAIFKENEFIKFKTHFSDQMNFFISNCLTDDLKYTIIKKIKLIKELRLPFLFT